MNNARRNFQASTDDPDIKYVSSQVRTAVKTNDVRALKSLICMAENGEFDLNQEDENGVTGLIEACISGDAKMVRMLLDAGCPAQPAGEDFRHTPLRGATVCGNAHLIPTLLAAGAHPNALSDGNRTPLMGACFLRSEIEYEKSALCVKALLDDSRTDPTIKNSFGESALDLAKIRGYAESVDLVQKALVEWGKKRNEESEENDKNPTSKKHVVGDEAPPKLQKRTKLSEATSK